MILLFIRFILIIHRRKISSNNRGRGRQDERGDRGSRREKSPEEWPSLGETVPNRQPQWYTTLYNTATILSIIMLAGHPL